MARDWLGAVGSLAGGLMNGIFSMAGAQQNAQAIKEANDKSLAYSDFYNKNKLQIMADDARKAGLSPYAAVGSASGSMSPTFTANTAMGDGLSKVGDAMQNALVNATFDKIDNNTKMDELDIQMKELEIQEKKAQIAKMNNQNAFGSDIPIASVMGMEAIPSPDKGSKGFRSGEIMDIGKGLQLQKTLDGEYLITPHPESMQGQMVSESFLNQAYSWIDTKKMLNNGGLEKIRSELKKAGKIPKGWIPDVYWTPFGYRVHLREDKPFKRGIHQIKTRPF